MTQPPGGSDVGVSTGSPAPSFTGVETKAQRQAGRQAFEAQLTPNSPSWARLVRRLPAVT